MENSDVEMKDATEQPINKNNVELHPHNGSVEVQPLESDDKLPPSTADQDAKPAKLGTQENLHGVNEPKDEVDAAKNSESELESPNSKEMANLLNMPAENVDQDQQLQLGEKTGEDQKMKENSELENTPMEKGEVPAESTVDMASHNETGVNEEIKGKKDEPSDDEVLTRKNEGMVNEPKQSEKMVAPTSSLEGGDKSKLSEAEREGGDADQNSTEVMVDAPKGSVKGDVPAITAADANASLGTSLDEQKPTTPLAMVQCPSTKSGVQNEESYRNTFLEEKMPGNEDGTPEEQAAFLRELERFYRERSSEFKAPRFYGHQLNCLKLWRSVIKLGGYERVTGCKLWRQVGESFHPPKTCTTISWTFRNFYEKALLEYEKHATESGDVQLPIFAGSDPSSFDNELLQGSSFQASGSGRGRREASARAMKGWHSRVLDNSEGGEQIMKDKNGNMMKREKSIKSIGSLKQKRPDEVEQPVKAARTEPSKPLVTSVVDVGPPADWVRINVRETKDCYEVYALVPGLLREEVRVQSDPAGRLVITGQPDQPDNPWGITAFKKVVSLPGRIDPLHTSAVVSLHGRLFVSVPFEH